MNAGYKLDRSHIRAVCQVAVPTIKPMIHTTPALKSDPVSGPVAGAVSDGPRLTVLYEELAPAAAAEDALNRCGYATRTGPMPDGRYGIQVAGWSVGRLERRSAYLRDTAADLGTHAALRDTADRAIETAAHLPLDADPRTAGHHAADEATEQMICAVVEEAGPFVHLTRFGSDPDLRDLLHTVQRQVDRVASIIRDHSAVASVAADVYLRIRHEHVARPTRRLARATAANGMVSTDTAQIADMVARAHALLRAAAFIAHPVNAEALVEAVKWARQRDPDTDPAAATDFAFDFALAYARDCHGIDRNRWPALDEAYQAWNQPRSSASPPGRAATSNQADAGSEPTPTVPQQGRGRGPQ